MQESDFLFFVLRSIRTKELSVFMRLNPSDNLKNLFEIPVLFYATSLYLFVTKQVDSTYVIAEWIFFVFRVLHSAVHCTNNIILVRFYVHLISSITVFFMIFRAMFAHFFWNFSSDKFFVSIACTAVYTRITARIYW